MSDSPDNNLLRDLIDSARNDTPTNSQWQAARKRLISHIELREIAQSNSNHPSTGCDPELATSKSTLRSVAWSAAGVALAASILTAVLLPAFSPQDTSSTASTIPFGRVKVVRGHCVQTDSHDTHRRLVGGDSITLGSMLQVGPGGGLRIELEDSTDLWLGAGAELVCTAPRGAPTATLRLTRGELRAVVAPMEGSTFSVETPAATLRVLGTQFNCRVLPALPEKEDQDMTELRKALRRAITVVTVLSGSVAVEAANSQQLLQQGQRTSIVAGSAPDSAQDLQNAQYAESWLEEPGKPDTGEILTFVPLQNNLIHSLWAIDIETGNSRRVTDFVGGRPTIIQRLGTEFAMINAGSILFAHFGFQPVGAAGSPMVNNQIILANLTTGEKLPLTPLLDYNLIYGEISPDNRRLAFVGSHDKTASGVPDYGLFVLDLESLEITKALGGALKTTPHWSTDSRIIAMSDSIGYTLNHNIVLIDVLTGDISKTDWHGADAHFLPNGDSLLYVGGFDKDCHSWHSGTPMGGNLYCASITNGETTQLTHFDNGGAIAPNISPDGKRLAYWEVTDANRLHILDFETQKDQVVTEVDCRVHLRWINGGQQLAIIPTIPERSRSWRDALSNFITGSNLIEVTLVDLTTDTPTTRITQLREPELSAEQKTLVADSADQLLAVFRTYYDGVDMQDRYRFDDAKNNFQSAADLLAQFTAELSSNDGPSPMLLLAESDLLAYQDFLNDEAAMSADDRYTETVATNLNCISALLKWYHREHGQFPEDIETLAKWSENGSWQIDHLRAGSDRARRLFLIPGDEQKTATTSYSLVDADPQQGRWTIETPRLNDGCRLTATYTFDSVQNGVKVNVDNN